MTSEKSKILNRTNFVLKAGWSKDEHELDAGPLPSLTATVIMPYVRVNH